MTDEVDDSQQEHRQPRRRHRRATRPATGDHAQVEVTVRPGLDDTDTGWAPDAGDGSDDAQRRSGRTSGSGGGGTAEPESAQDRWWREQRPPHWD